MSDFTTNKVFNITLKNLGVTTGVQNAQQNEKNIVVLKEYYEIALNKVLSAHDWAFACAYRNLALTGNIPVNPKFLYEYDYPNDCVAVREIVLCDDYVAQDYEVASNTSGQKIINANITPAVVRYTRTIDNVALCPPDFILTLSWYLAYLASTSIVNTRTKTSDCLTLYKQCLIEAKTADANEQHKTDNFNGYSEERD